MSQTHSNKPSGGDAGEDTDWQLVRAANTSNADSLLDEIDDLLETNAEEFVKSYVQKGGQ